MEYSRLFTPITINGMQLKNRICMSAVDLNYCEEGYGQVSERLKAFYYARAEGGAGLITVGGCRFEEYGAAEKGFVSIADDSYMQGHHELTDGVHARGSKIALQLYHAGRYSRKKCLAERGLEYALAPSQVPSSYTGYEMPRELTVIEIRKIIEKWADAAVRAKQCGYDAVEISGSAGYLVTQFLSPLTNQRTDVYGGSFENRTRFVRELIRAVRSKVGEDYPIIMRMAGNDFVPGSNTNTEAVEFAKLYEQCGVDMLSVTGGWHETRVPQLPGEVPHGAFAYLAQPIKEAVSIPVFVANRIQDPYVAESILAIGQADGIAMCRTLLADPHWPIKAKEGREKEIRKCVGCNQGCLAATWFGKPVACLVNGECGYETQLQWKPVEKRKKILVVGGGPAGMEFAVRAAARGHAVTLWEGKEQLGGWLHLLSAPPGKKDFKDLNAYYVHMLKLQGVRVITNKWATVKEVTAQQFDEVVLATGALPRMIEIQNNAGDIPVVTAFDVLEEKVIPGKHVVVVGGGAVGCETAQFLAQQGAIDAEKLFFLTIHKAETQEKLEELVNKSARKVSIVEIASKIGTGFDRGCAWPIMKDLKRLDVDQYANAQILGTKARTAIIRYTEQNGNVVQGEIPCDTIVLAVGSVPNNHLFQEFQNNGVSVHLIGNGKKIGRVLDAIRQADDLAAVI